MKEKQIKTSLYVPQELWKRVKIEAIQRDMDATHIVVAALENYLKQKVAKS
jgi:hypothetical protein